MEFQLVSSIDGGEPKTKWVQARIAGYNPVNSTYQLVGIKLDIPGHADGTHGAALPQKIRWPGGKL